MGLYFQSTVGTVFIPSAIPIVSVQSANSGIATTGVMCLVGEAAGGPSYSQDTVLANENSFGAGDLALVQAKYLSGNLVSAFQNAIDASNDPAITAAPGLIYLIKTNSGTKADYTLTVPGINTNYSVLADQNWGTLGNNIYAQILSFNQEVAPTTGTYTYLPNFSNGSTIAFRVNGGAVQTQTISTNLSPDILNNTINGVVYLSPPTTPGTIFVGLLATGGVSDFAAITNGLSTSIQTSLTYVSGSSITISLASGSWAVNPTAGMTLTISGGSGLVGAGSVNEGSYLVTSATASTIVCSRIAANNSSASFVSVSASSGTALSTTPFNIYTTSSIQEVGGVNRGAISGASSPHLTGVVTGNSVVMTLDQNWTVQPVVGDQVFLQAGSLTNQGWFTVTASTATTVTCNLIGLFTVDDVLTSFSSTSISTSTFAVLRPAIPGVGKTLEFQDGGGTANITTNFFTTAGAQATWISTLASQAIETSATENAVTFTANRPVTNNADNLTDIGGNVVLVVAYQGTTATLTVNATNNVPTSITTSVTGGVGANLTGGTAVNLTTFTTLNAVASYINAQPGYSCQVGSALFGQLPSSSLDIVSGVGICSTNNAAATLAGPGRLKADAQAFYNAITNQSTLVEETNSTNVSAGTYTPIRGVAGLPDPTAVFFLSGGSVGGTSNSNVAGALTAAQVVTCNSIVPLFSQNASLDASAGLTDSSSSYTIASINAQFVSHVIAMSTALLKKNRQAYLSDRDTYLNVKQAAANIAQYRCSLCFQDVKALNSQGTLVQYQPWMLATLGAAMQMAGFYKSVTNKLINCSGVVQAAGDWNDQNYSQVSDAIANGLFVAQRSVSGGIKWVADQTTYGADQNFVYNRIQAIYDADLIALTIAQRMQDAFVGQAVADASASVALAFLAGIMNDLKRLKLTVATDTAPAGYLNASVKINGPVMAVALQAALDGAIYFIPININIVQPQQSAG